MKRHLTLFCEMFFISTFVLGGGYVILSVADTRFSRKLKLIREGELFEMLPLFQSIPGIIGAHTAVYLGHRLAGLSGAIVSLAGVLLPSILIFLTISRLYAHIPLDAPMMEAAFLGLRAALAGLMAEIALRLARKSERDAYALSAFVLSTVLLFSHLISPGPIIAIGALAGIALTAADDRRAAERGRRVFRSITAIPLLFIGYGLIAFGGGFVLVPAYVSDFVGEGARLLQIAPHDFANIIALTEMTPGPVAANCATFFGYRLGGIPGALLATATLILPGSAILLVALRSVERFRTSVIVRGVFRGVRPVTLALIVCATATFLRLSVFHADAETLAISPLGTLLTIAAFAAALSRRIGEVLIILATALASIAIRWII